MPARVLFVDDDRNLCQIVAKALRGEGYEVQTAFDGESALSQIQDEAPDLLLLDVLLPRKDGFQVLEELRVLGPPFTALPVVLLTSCTPTPAYAKRATALDAADLLVKPVPLDRLLEVVVSHVGEAKAQVGTKAERESEPRPGKRSTISGQLDRIPFPAVLHHLHGLRATGVLHLSCEKKLKWIQLRDGYPVAVRSNLVSETLGCYLERSGRISRAVLEESRRRMKSDARRQGEVLVAMQVLSEEQVAVALRDQADEKLFEIFGWDAGRFHFERDGKLDRANVLGLGRSPANLILEGVRSRFSIARIDRYLRGQAQRWVVHGSSPFYRFQELYMDPTEEALLRGLDGSQPLGAFLREEESVRRTVYALLAAGLLELQGGAGEATEGRREVAAKAPAAPARQAPPPARQAAASPAKPTREPPPKAAPARPSKPAAAQPAKRAPTQPAKRAPTQPVKPATALPAKPAPGPLAKSSPAKLAAREPQKAARPQPTSAPDAAASHPPELAALAQKLHAQNHFDLLGVPENATPEVVRRASERLLAQVHPDRYSGESRTVKALAEQIFRRVTEAQQALSDPRKRQEHVLDKRRAEREASRQQQAERALAAETAFRDGETALRARDYESALRWFGKALELYPDEGDHHAHYGWALYLCHPSDPAMLAEALEHVRRGLKTASHREMPYLFMGRLYKALGRPEVAERMFTRAVQIQPECVEALRELRLIAMRREKSKGLIGRLLRR